MSLPGTCALVWAKIASAVRSVFLVITFLGFIARAQQPVGVEFKCADDDIQFFGLACTSEQPCPVYLELTSLEPVGAKLFVTGNFHTPEVTLSSILLMSADEGKTWTEPYQRIRSASLGEVQFVNLEKGWASGETVQSLPRDPFFLVTTDSGTTWQQRPVFEEDRVGSIVQFWFDSPSSGSMVVESGSKNELYETMTGGSTWSVREIKDSPIRLKESARTLNTDWRLRADAITKTYRVETRRREDKSQGERWRTVASFPIHVADCKPGDAERVPAPESETPGKTEAPASGAPQPRKPPSLKPGETP